MDKTIMTYTILKEYNKIDSLISNLSSSIKTGAMNAYNQTGDIFTRICDLLEYKRVLFNVKTIVKQAVRELTPFERQIFKLSYLRGEQAVHIAESLNVNKNQVYREIKKLPAKVLSHLEKDCSYFDEFCQEDYLKANYLRKAYEHNINSDKTLTA